MNKKSHESCIQTELVFEFDTMSEMQTVWKATVSECLNFILLRFLELNIYLEITVCPRFNQYKLDLISLRFTRLF